MNNLLWYKNAVIYQIHVKTFFDTANDGIGDFKGLTQKLDYLEELGITCIWLMPFYPSPLKDDGYDISDYYSVHPDYGTLNDFQFFLREAHKKNSSLITLRIRIHGFRNPGLLRQVLTGEIFMSGVLCRINLRMRE